MKDFLYEQHEKLFLLQLKKKGADVHVSIIKKSVLHLGRVSTWIALLINRSESALQKTDFRNKTAGLFSDLDNFLDGR